MINNLLEHYLHSIPGQVVEQVRGNISIGSTCLWMHMHVTFLKFIRLLMRDCFTIEREAKSLDCSLRLPNSCAIHSTENNLKITQFIINDSCIRALIIKPILTFPTTPIFT